MKKPIVAIVGRSNVGKSKLFNRLIQENKSIVLDKKHITRDRIYGTCDWLGREFNLIDTGGLETTNVEFMSEIKLQVEIAISEADVILFVVDGKDEITFDDNYISKILLKSLKPIILVVNKTDNIEESYNKSNYYSLGFKTIIATSSIHGIGIGELLNEIVKKTNHKEIENDNVYLSLAVLGKVNVGKSTFINAVVGSNRVITSDIPGTTRDSVDVTFKKNQREYVLIDTAGIRRQKKIYEEVEKFAILKSKISVDRSKIILFFIDASKDFTEQDEKIAGIIKESNKPMIVVANKMDLIINKEKKMKEFKDNFKFKFKFIKDPLFAFVSSLEKTNLQKIFKLLDEMVNSLNFDIKTSQINKVMQDLQLMKSPGTIRGRKLRVYYATYKKDPIPTFLLFVNNKTLCHFSYLRYIENQIRINFPFPGIPIKINLRNKKGDIYE